MNITIVNENDEVIGAEERSIAKTQSIYRVSALWVIDGYNNVLLAKRSMGKDTQPGVWGPAAAGTVDQGESYEDTIYREAEEEIGLKKTKLKQGVKVRISEEQNNFFCQWYTATLQQPEDSFTLQADEVDEVRWVNITDLKSKLKENPENYIPAIHEYLKDTAG